MPECGSLTAVIVQVTENIDAKDAERIFAEFTSTKMTFVFHVIEEEEMQGNTDG